MHHMMFNTRRNPALKLMKVEVDPLETFDCLKAMRDEALNHIKKRVGDLSKGLDGDRSYYGDFLVGRDS